MKKADVQSCGCGCGQDVTRRYKQGHDARHKSQLLAIVYHSDNVVDVKKARKALTKLSWAHFIDESKVLQHRSKRDGAKALIA